MDSLDFVDPNGKRIRVESVDTDPSHVRVITNGQADDAERVAAVKLGHDKLTLLLGPTLREVRVPFAAVTGFEASPQPPPSAALFLATIPGPDAEGTAASGSMYI